MEIKPFGKWPKRYLVVMCVPILHGGIRKKRHYGTKHTGIKFYVDGRPSGPWYQDPYVFGESADDVKMLAR